MVKIKKGNRTYNIKMVSPKILHDYAGMNKYAGKVMGFNRHLKPSEILIDKNLPKRVKKETIRHEILEIEQMRKGKDYFDSHLIALKGERKKMICVDKLFL